jgi:phage/conjugal plasmid C-4 type zinc finger TraR family protein
MADVVDQAGWLTETERAEGVRRVKESLAVAGAAACIGCGDDIEPARRAALPSARRCITCQGRVERREASCARPAIVDGGIVLNFRGKKS